MIVDGRDVLLKVFKNGIENAVACNTSCSLTIDTDLFETTFINSGSFRQWIPNKHTITLNGSGPVYLGEPITIADTIEWQLNRQLVEFNFIMTDEEGSVLRVNGMGYFTKNNVDGTVAQFATCDYTIQVNGVVTFYSNNNGVNADDDRVLPPYEAEGGEVTIGFEELIDAKIVYIAREGVGVKIITSGTPSGSEVLFNTGNGTLTFGTALMAEEWIHVIYQV